MKKIFSVTASLLLTTSLLYGCGAKVTKAPSSGSDATSSATTNENKERLAIKADLQGEVSSIEGNKITLKIIKMPDFQGRTQREPQSKDGQQQNGQNGESPKAPQNRQIEYTGESKQLTIPESIQINLLMRGNQGEQANKLQLKDIKVGDIIQITYSDKEKEIVSQITIIPFKQSTTNTQDQSNTQNKTS